MKKRLWFHCAVLSILLNMSFTAFGQKVTTLSNAELFSRQYARVDTANFDGDKNNLLTDNDNFYFPYAKCVVYGFLGEVIGGGVGFVVAVIIPDIRKESEGLAGMGYALRNGFIGAGIGATIGCAIGVHNGGKKNRKNIFIPALAGAVIAPVGVAAYLNYNDKQATTETILLVSVVTPIISTAATYLFGRKIK